MLARRDFAIILGVTLAVLGLAGCGGTSNASTAKSNDCKAVLVSATEAQVLRALYANGKLGSVQQIRAETSKAHPFVRDDGTMVPYSQMSSWQRASFDVWRVSARIDRLAHDQLEDADRRAIAAAETKCA